MFALPTRSPTGIGTEGVMHRMCQPRQAAENRRAAWHRCEASGMRFPGLGEIPHAHRPRFRVNPPCDDRGLLRYGAGGLSALDTSAFTGR